MFRIPEPQLNHLNVDPFPLSSLQSYGLINDGNICSLISLIMVFHRMLIRNNLVDPNLLLDDQGNTNYPLCLLSKILWALPSPRTFSIRNFISSWNNCNMAPRIQANDDITPLADALIRQLKLKNVANGEQPVLTKYVLRFQCNNCGFYEVMENWIGKAFSVVPTISVPRLGSVSLQGLKLVSCHLYLLFISKLFDPHSKVSRCNQSRGFTPGLSCRFIFI